MRSNAWTRIIAAAALLFAVALPSCKTSTSQGGGDQPDVLAAQPAPEAKPPVPPAAPQPTCPHAKAMEGAGGGCPHMKEAGAHECGCKKEGEQEMVEEHECPFHEGGAAKKAPPGAITCPIGGDVIEDVKKALKSEYKGKTYYFGCEACKAKFDADPETYADKAP